MLLPSFYRLRVWTRCLGEVVTCPDLHDSQMLGSTWYALPPSQVFSAPWSFAESPVLPPSPRPRTGRDWEQRWPLLPQILAPSLHSSRLEPIVLVYYVAGRGKELICLPKQGEVGWSRWGMTHTGGTWVEMGGEKSVVLVSRSVYRHFLRWRAYSLRYSHVLGDDNGLV